MPKDKQQKYLINNLFKRKSQNILEGIGKQLLICLSVGQKFMDYHKQNSVKTFRNRQQHLTLIRLETHTHVLLLRLLGR